MGRREGLTDQVNHRLLFNGCFQRISSGALRRYIDPNLRFFGKSRIPWKDDRRVRTMIARFLHATLILDHIFLPSWYLVRAHIYTYEHKNHIMELTVHRQTMF